MAIPPDHQCRIAALLFLATLAFSPHATADPRSAAYEPLAGGTNLCGNGIPDPGEACDDGNVANADGCSSSCRVESGFACTTAQPPVISNGVTNGDFEAMPGEPTWSSGSSAFGTPLCTLGRCGATAASQPAAGTGWAWLGGALIPETGFIEQTVVLEPTDATLDFDLVQNRCDGPADTLTLTLDGNPVWNANGDDPRCGDPVYQRITIDLAALPGGPYNDGQAHVLRFEAHTQALNGGETNFLIDNVGVVRDTSTGQPSACAPIPGACQTQAFDPSLAGDFSSIGWTTFTGATSETGQVWGTSDDTQCHTANALPGNFTGGDGHSACIDSDAAGMGMTDAYLCTGALDLRGRKQSGAQFRLSYHAFGPLDDDDLLQVLAGTLPPDNATVGGFDTLWRAAGPAGPLFDVPGETISLDLAAYDNAPQAYLCLRYRGDFDWSAQIDDLTLTSANCNTIDADGDGVLNTIDNCTDVSNPQQIDSNGDGIGNRCDADIAGPLGVGIDDCIVNVLDLAALRQAFGSTPDAANWNPHADFAGPDGPPDGRINAVDLGRLKLGFFQTPGPSAEECQQ